MQVPEYFIEKLKDNTAFYEEYNFQKYDTRM